ncbi:ABC-2 type transport system permease protein [Tistlia consotensis]|uniref:ABC-2 type transport system permease protein n=1 Tax=Tistlia consotensis USBA 355 TaxID=560819 RepID=A0A1Y6CMN3_9PROT|nr:ABC transporter permease [Tistlia consotensis]SMF60308.1 ABC-2 type transport system permease protein [Tistlia consotensis USBA 355]SNR93580.1 ABC-2 type transport system permease protein [Tistlia consotensis]
MTAAFSFARFLAVLVKEFIQMRRDRVTFAMMIGVPILQLTIFGYAINTDPKHLPTLVESNDDGPITRALLAALENSAYFDFRGTVAGEAEASRALRSGEAIFVVVVPPRFERDLVRGERPAILLSADASDPTATGGAIAALSGIVDGALAASLTGPLQGLAARPPAFQILVHRHYNPAGVTSFNIVPGLLGTILSMTMVMITAIAIVREAERGTMETLIATPVRPAEVMLGKILPYVLVGYVQTSVFLALALTAFGVPFAGSAAAFLVGLNLFIVANLALGFLFSTVARNQMQAMQMSFFYMLPAILLSGFLFPFSGMPGWARAIGIAIPNTHFIRIVREVMLKGAGLSDILPELGALAAIVVVITALAMLRYRQTLD